MLSYIGVRMVKHFRPQHSDSFIEVTVQTIDDLGKVQTITGLLQTSTDSLESQQFMNCLNDLNFFNSSYASAVDACYDNAMSYARKTNSSFSEVLHKMRRSLGEMKDNHEFYQEVYGLLQANTTINFDSAWQVHFKRPSKIDLEYKPVLERHYNNTTDIKRSLDNTSKLLKRLDSINNKSQ